MNEPKTLHIWMPDNRSLCDRRARSARKLTDIDDEAEFNAQLNADLDAPVCGACLLTSSHIRLEAAKLLAAAGRRSIYPSIPADAYLSLQGTRWAFLNDPPPDELNDPDYYETCVIGQVAAQDLDAARGTIADQARSEHIRAKRKARST